MSVNVLQQRTATQGYDIMGGGTPQPEEAEMDLVPTDGSSNPVTSNGIYDALLTKQDTLTFDATPTDDSTNPVTSDGIYTALGTKQDTLTFDDVPTNGSTNPVTSDGIFDALDTKQDNLNIQDGSFYVTPTAAKTLTYAGSISVPSGKMIFLELIPRYSEDIPWGSAIYLEQSAEPSSRNILDIRIADDNKGVYANCIHCNTSNSNQTLYLYGEWNGTHTSLLMYRYVMI